MKQYDFRVVELSPNKTYAFYPQSVRASNFVTMRVGSNVERIVANGNGFYDTTEAIEKKGMTWGNVELRSR